MTSGKRSTLGVSFQFNDSDDSINAGYSESLASGYSLEATQHDSQTSVDSARRNSSYEESHEGSSSSKLHRWETKGDEQSMILHVSKRPEVDEPKGKIRHGQKSSSKNLGHLRSEMFATTQPTVEKPQIPETWGAEDVEPTRPDSVEGYGTARNTRDRAYSPNSNKSWKRRGKQSAESAERRPLLKNTKNQSTNIRIIPRSPTDRRYPKTSDPGSRKFMNNPDTTKQRQASSRREISLHDASRYSDSEGASSQGARVFLPPVTPEERELNWNERSFEKDDSYWRNSRRLRAISTKDVHFMSTEKSASGTIDSGTLASTQKYEVHESFGTKDQKTLGDLNERRDRSSAAQAERKITSKRHGSVDLENKPQKENIEHSEQWPKKMTTGVDEVEKPPSQDSPSFLLKKPGRKPYVPMTPYASKPMKIHRKTSSSNKLEEPAPAQPERMKRSQKHHNKLHLPPSNVEFKKKRNSSDKNKQRTRISEVNIKLKSSEQLKVSETGRYRSTSQPFVMGAKKSEGIESRSRMSTASNSKKIDREQLTTEKEPQPGTSQIQELEKSNESATLRDEISNEDADQKVLPNGEMKFSSRTSAAKEKISDISLSAKNDIEDYEIPGEILEGNTKQNEETGYIESTEMPRLEKIQSRSKVSLEEEKPILDFVSHFENRVEAVRSGSVVSSELFQEIIEQKEEISSSKSEEIKSLKLSLTLEQPSEFSHKIEPVQSGFDIPDEFPSKTVEQNDAMGSITSTETGKKVKASSDFPDYRVDSLHSKIPGEYLEKSVAQQNSFESIKSEKSDEIESGLNFYVTIEKAFSDFSLHARNVSDPIQSNPNIPEEHVEETFPRIEEMTPFEVTDINSPLMLKNEDDQPANKIEEVSSAQSSKLNVSNRRVIEIGESLEEIKELSISKIDDTFKIRESHENEVRMKEKVDEDILSNFIEEFPEIKDVLDDDTRNAGPSIEDEPASKIESSSANTRKITSPPPSSNFQPEKTFASPSTNLQPKKNFGNGENETQKSSQTVSNAEKNPLLHDNMQSWPSGSKQSSPMESHEMTNRLSPSPKETSSMSRKKPLEPSAAPEKSLTETDDVSVDSSRPDHPCKRVFQNICGILSKFLYPIQFPETASPPLHAKKEEEPAEAFSIVHLLHAIFRQIDGENGVILLTVIQNPFLKSVNVDDRSGTIFQLHEPDLRHLLLPLLNHAMQNFRSIESIIFDDIELGAAVIFMKSRPSSSIENNHGFPLEVLPLAEIVCTEAASLISPSFMTLNWIVRHISQPIPNFINNATLLELLGLVETMPDDPLPILQRRHSLVYPAEIQELITDLIMYVAGIALSSEFVNILLNSSGMLIKPIIEKRGVFQKCHYVEFVNVNGVTPTLHCFLGRQVYKILCFVVKNTSRPLMDLVEERDYRDCMTDGILSCNVRIAPSTFVMKITKEIAFPGLQNMK